MRYFLFNVRWMEWSSMLLKNYCLLGKFKALLFWKTGSFLQGVVVADGF